MRLRRLLSLATALGLAAMMGVPTSALAHDIAETMVRFDGNYFMVSVVSVEPSEPLTEVRLDVYDGKIGRVKEATLVTAAVYSSGWEAAEEPGTCRVKRTQWFGQYSPPNTDETVVKFTSPYSGSLDVALELHGRHLIHDGVLKLSDNGNWWCDYELEPVSLTDLGETDFTAVATWTSDVTGKGRHRTVITTVLLETVTFGDSSLTLDGDQINCSMARRMQIPVFDFIE